MNVALLRQVEKHILEEPKRLYMGDWIVRDVSTKTATDLGWMLYDRVIARKVPACDTVGCIWGWAQELDPSTKKSNSRNSPMEVLGLDSRQAERLFHVRSWPLQFCKIYKDDGSLESAKILVERLEFFIKTNGSDKEPDGYLESL